MSYFNIQHNFKQHFLNNIIAAGITPPTQILDDGVVHRFSSNGHPKNTDGWYIVDGANFQTAAFGCWRLGTASSVKGIRHD